MDFERWKLQLSLYAHACDHKNLSREKAYVIYLRGSEARLIDVPLYTEVEIEELLRKYLAGEKLERKDELILTDSDSDALALCDIAEYQAIEIQIKNLEDAKQRIKDFLLSKFQETGTTRFVSESLKAAYIPESEKETFDSTRFKAEHPELAKQFVKITKVKSHVKITPTNNGGNDE